MKKVLLVVLILAFVGSLSLYLRERKLHTKTAFEFGKAVSESDKFKDNLFKSRGYWHKFIFMKDGEMKWVVMKNTDMDWDVAKKLNRDDISGELELAARLTDFESGVTSPRLKYSSEKWKGVVE